MKATSRRFGRSTAPEVTDEGMGGGDYPVVFAGVSTESPIRVIPEQGAADLTVSLEPPQYDNFWGTAEKEKKSRLWSGVRKTVPDESAAEPSVSPEPPQAGDDDNFWGTRGKDKKPRSWWRERRTYFIATAVIAVLAVVAAMLSFSGGSSQAKRVSYTFPVEAFPQAGVTVSRTWTIYEGKHPTLQGDLVFYSSRSDQVTVEELLPKSLVTQASQVTFQPKPRVVSEDPVVVSYSIAPALDGVTSVTYQFPIPGRDLSLAALHRWASEQTTESGQHFLASHKLASISITPASIVVKKGGAPYQLAISGLQSNSEAAPTVAFGSATWSVANPKVAKVSTKGLVTGLAAGKTTVRAVVGKLSATANVVVSAAANVKPTPPLKVLAAGPLLSLSPQAFASSLGVIASGGPVVTHTRKPVTAHSRPPVTVHSPPPVSKPPVTPPSPQCNTASMLGPSGLAATPSSTTAGAVAVSWGSASSTPPCPAVSGYTAFVDGVPTTSTTGNGTALGGLAGGQHSLTVYASFANGSSIPSGALSFVAPVLCSDGVTVTINPASCPLPPPTCNAASETPPGTPALVASTSVAGEISVSWGSAGFLSPCALSSYTVLVNGVAVQSGIGGNGTTLEGQTGTVSVAIQAFFADGTSQQGGAAAVEATMLCPDGITIAVPESCPAVPPPPGP